jgi:hypothetical protein
LGSFSTGRDAVRRPGLGFLGTARFAYENPSFWGLDFLGFPWILSCETIDINWLHEIFARNFFLALLSSRKIRRNGDPTIWHAKRTDCSWGKLTSISDFLQEIAARAAYFRPPPSKSKSLARDIVGHDVWTASQMGWKTIKDRELLALAAGRFDMFVTVDRNFSIQQNLAPLPISVFALHAKTNRLSDLKPLVPSLLAALETAPQGVAHIINAV